MYNFRGVIRVSLSDFTGVDTYVHVYLLHVDSIAKE